jgi:hypothetical protein
MTDPSVHEDTGPRRRKAKNPSANAAARPQPTRDSNLNHSNSNPTYQESDKIASGAVKAASGQVKANGVPTKTPFLPRLPNDRLAKMVAQADDDSEEMSDSELEELLNAEGISSGGMPFKKRHKDSESTLGKLYNYS